MKRYGGSGVPQGTLHKGTQPRPNPVHGGSGAPRVVHAPRPQVYGTHGGTKLSRVTKPISSPSARQARLATSYHGNVRK